jgi:diaminopimelate epimerase
MFNADGSEAEMCGNAVRCVAKYVYDRRMTRSRSPRIETGRGVLRLELHTDPDDLVERVRVDMAEPILERAQIPMVGPAGRVVDEPLEVAGRTYRITAVSMGNPHCVVFVDEPDEIDLPDVGPLFENHPAFPRRTNTEFVKVGGPAHLKMRVWERGAGETLACGTGACAAAVAGVLTGRSGRRVKVELRGGVLALEWDEATGRVFMTGPAVEVYSGSWPEEERR